MILCRFGDQLKFSAIFLLGFLALAPNVEAEESPQDFAKVANPSPLEVEVVVGDHPKQFTDVAGNFLDVRKECGEVLLAMTPRVAPGLITFAKIEIRISATERNEKLSRVFNVSGALVKDQTTLLFLGSGGAFEKELARQIREAKSQIGMINAESETLKVSILLRDVNIQ